MKKMQAILFLILMISLTNAALGQLLRNFPADSPAGKLTGFDYPMVVISRQNLYLSPGSQIRDANNLIVMPAALNAQGLVRYQMDNMGNVQKIWILNPEEAEIAQVEINNNSNRVLEFVKDLMPF